MNKHETLHLRLDEVRTSANNDSEGAHIAEKELWKEALLMIASGHPDAQETARIALRSLDIEFERWFA